MVALDDLHRATGLEVDFKIGPGWAIQEAIDKTYRRMVSTEGIDEALRQDLGLSVGTVPATTSWWTSSSSGRRPPIPPSSRS